VDDRAFVLHRRLQTQRRRRGVKHCSPGALLPTRRSGVVDVHAVVHTSPFVAPQHAPDVGVVPAGAEHLSPRNDTCLTAENRDNLRVGGSAFVIHVVDLRGSARAGTRPRVARLWITVYASDLSHILTAIRGVAGTAAPQRCARDAVLTDCRVWHR